MSPRLTTCGLASLSMDGTLQWRVGAGIRVVCRRMSNIHQTSRRKCLAEVMHNYPPSALPRQLGGRIKPNSVSGVLDRYMPWLATFSVSSYRDHIAGAARR